MQVVAKYSTQRVDLTVLCKYVQNVGGFHSTFELDFMYLFTHLFIHLFILLLRLLG